MNDEDFQALSYAGDLNAYYITAHPVEDAMSLLQRLHDLETRGLVEVQTSQDDRGYVTQYVLTAAGRQALEDV